MMQAAASAAHARLDPARFFRLLGEETRLRAAVLLHQQGELCVCELTEALGVSQPKMSRHLGHLRDVGLVETRRSGQWIHYRLRNDLPAWAHDLLTGVARDLADEPPFSGDTPRVRRAIARHRSECEQ